MSGCSIGSEYEYQFKEIARIHQFSSVKEVFVDNNIMSVACAGDGVGIYDVSDPANPREIGLFDTQCALDVCHDSQFVYIADNYGGLKIIDYTTEDILTLSGSLSCISEARRITLDNDVVLIGGGDGGLYIVDVSERSEPEIIGHSPITDGSARKAYVKDPYVFLAKQMAGLDIIDITNKTNPRQVKNIPSKYFNDDVLIENDMMFVTEADFGISIYDISNPSNPILIGEKQNYCPYARVAKYRDFLVIAAFSCAYILDISDISNIQLVGSEACERAIGIDISDNGIIYLADDRAGLAVYQINSNKKY